MRSKLIIILSLLCCIPLVACSADESVSKIADTSFAEALFVQKVKNNTSTEEQTKKITDPLKIEKTVKLVDGLKVKKTTSDKVLNMMKTEDTYMFYFSKTDETTTGKVPYVFHILGNGRVIFTHGDVDELLEEPLITKETHEELLEKMKKELSIDF
jgi:hypothetical protein